MDLLPYVEAVTFEQFTTYVKTQLLRRADVTSLVVGNIGEKAALGMVQEAVEKLRKGIGMAPTPPAEVPCIREMQLPRGSAFEYRQDAPNPENPNSASVVLFQVRGTGERAGSFGVPGLAEGFGLGWVVPA